MLSARMDRLSTKEKQPVGISDRLFFLCVAAKNELSCNLFSDVIQYRVDRGCPDWADPP